MMKVNFIRGGGDMYGLRASTAIINSGIFSSAPVSLIQVGTDNLTPPATPPRPHPPSPPSSAIYRSQTAARHPEVSCKCACGVMGGRPSMPHSFAHQEGREGSFDPINAEENRLNKVCRLTPGHPARLCVWSVCVDG